MRKKDARKEEEVRMKDGGRRTEGGSLERKMRKQTVMYWLAPL